MMAVDLFLSVSALYDWLGAEQVLFSLRIPYMWVDCVREAPLETFGYTEETA